jgi:hypothetical protein
MRLSFKFSLKDSWLFKGKKTSRCYSIANIDITKLCKITLGLYWPLSPHFLSVSEAVV